MKKILYITNESDLDRFKDKNRLYRYEAIQKNKVEYKFIPRSKQYTIYKGTAENKLLVDINPPLQLKDTIIENLLIPLKYIIDEGYNDRELPRWVLARLVD